MYTGFWWGNLRERDHLGDPGVDGRIILRWIFRKWDVGVWTGSSWLRIGTDRHRQTDRQTDRWVDRRTDRQTDGQTDGRTDRRTDGQTDGRTDRQTDGRTDRQTDR